MYLCISSNVSSMIKLDAFQEGNVVKIERFISFHVCLYCYTGDTASLCEK